MHRVGGIADSDKADTHERTLRRALQSLRDKKIIEVFEGYTWLADKADKPGHF